MGLITNIQGLPGVTQKAHNAPFLAWTALLRCLAKLALKVQRADGLYS